MSKTEKALAEIMRRLEAIEERVGCGTSGTTQQKDGSLPLSDSSGCCGGGKSGSFPVRNRAFPEGSVEKIPFSKGIFLHVQNHVIPDLDAEDVPYKFTSTWLADQYGNSLTGEYCHCSGDNCTGSSWCEKGEQKGCNCNSDCRVFCE